MDGDLRAFFDFNSMHMEPWDGPAGIVMSDGRYAACNLDRNGLRPARYVITKDKLITCASEVGIWDYQPDEVVEKGRVGPGELMVIDTRSGRILHSAETDNDLKSRHPYKEWMEKNVKRLVPFEDLPDDQVGSRELDDAQLETYQKQFGYSSEELDQVIRVLGEIGQKPPVRWATIPRSPCSPAGRASFTTISASSSRRSPTRRSIRCAKRTSCRWPPASAVK